MPAPGAELPRHSNSFHFCITGRPIPSDMPAILGAAPIIIGLNLEKGGKKCQVALKPLFSATTTSCEERFECKKPLIAQLRIVIKELFMLSGYVRAETCDFRKLGAPVLQRTN